MRCNSKQDELGRFVSNDGTPAPKPEPGVKIRRGSTQFKHYRVDEVLSDAERDEYEKLLAHPTTTVKQLQKFLKDKGHAVCRSAVTRHRQAFHASLKRMREVSRMAASFCELARTQGAGSVAEASHAMFEMKLMESLFNVSGAEKLPPEQWQTMSKTLQGVIATRRSVEEMRGEFDRKAKEAAQVAEKAAGDGATTQDVVARVKEILGV